MIPTWFGKLTGEHPRYHQSTRAAVGSAYGEAENIIRGRAVDYRSERLSLPLR